MDNAQVGQELEDLEARLERLRALYEQYFMGLEKLEPMVLRKDVDRRVWMLRREQIRNTGLRFKFQMLIQRYNTYQQYWGRIVREIENGTYRRDILKVAKRFGDQDAMTILGRKRAEQYKRLAVNQLDRRKKLRGEGAGEAEGAAADRPSMPDITIEEEDAPVSLSVSDLEMLEDADDDDPPTPARGLPPVRMYGEPDMESLLLAATVGVTTWSEPTAATAPKPAPPRTGPSTIDGPAAGPPDTSASRAQDDPTDAKPSAAPAQGRPARGLAAGSAAGIVMRPPPAPAPAKTASTTSKSRVAELAAQMRAKKQGTAKPKTEDLEIDQLFDGPSAAPAPLPRFTPAPPAPKALPTVAPALKPPKRASVPAPPLATKPTRRASVPPPPARPASTRPPPAKPASRPPPAKPASRPPPAKPPRAPSRGEDLSEQKMREIYVKYVGAKRAANESTAGITFDKLAASLRAQTDKLKTTHPTRSVDFEVVTKDGKTALRPVVK